MIVNMDERAYAKIYGDFTDSETPQSPLGLSMEEAAECCYYKKECGISEFQKLLTGRRVKILKTC